MEFEFPEHIEINPTKYLDSPLKKVGERVFVGIGLGIMSPLLILAGVIIAASIKMEDGGPIFFVQKRVKSIDEANNIEYIYVWKFRTLKNGTHLNSNRLILYDEGVSAEQPIPTRIGNFLRKTNLDELPQLIQVILGQIGLIGPRLLNTSTYEYVKMRLIERPILYKDWVQARSKSNGIICFHQLHDNRKADQIGSVLPDIDYINKASLSVDLDILIFMIVRALMFPVRKLNQKMPAVNINLR